MRKIHAQATRYNATWKRTRGNPHVSKQNVTIIGYYGYYYAADRVCMCSTLIWVRDLQGKHRVVKIIFSQSLLSRTTTIIIIYAVPTHSHTRNNRDRCEIGNREEKSRIISAFSHCNPVFTRSRVRTYIIVCLYKNTRGWYIIASRSSPRRGGHVDTRAPGTYLPTYGRRTVNYYYFNAVFSRPKVAGR